MRIGILGGSFDPVHIEHVRIAQAAITELALDELFVMPAYAPPHKKGKVLSADEDRLAMCRLAFQDIKQVTVSDYEIARGGMSYTYLTCREFKNRYPQAELFFLVGTDMLRDFPTWKNPNEILSYATLAVCGRNEEEGWMEAEQAFFQARFQKKFAYVSYNGTDVSSTKIRVMAGAGMRLDDYLPTPVAEYIQAKGLYAIPYAKEALALEKPTRAAHSLRVAMLAAKRAVTLKLSEKEAIAAALFHDCAKNLSWDSVYLQGFTAPTEWGTIPTEVVHQFAGAYVAEKYFGVANEDVLNAIRYHTSARPRMCKLEQLIFLADMLEEERCYEGVEALRALFWQGDSLDVCLKTALYETLQFLEKKGGEVYPLTRQAYAYYAENIAEEGMEV